MEKPQNSKTIILLFLLLSFSVFSQESDPLGTNYKKTLITETLEKLTKRNLPSTQTGANLKSVHIFLIAYSSTSLKLTKPFEILKYSDGTWPFAREIIKNYSAEINHPIERIKLIGYFNTVDEAIKEWDEVNTTLTAFGLKSEIVDFDNKIALKIANNKPQLPKEQNNIKTEERQTGITIVNLPEINVKAKERITLGIMPIIDSSSNLSQQFTIYQFLKDNPIIINSSDTLFATITDTRTFTYFAISGTSGHNSFRFKIWQKDKLLAEIVHEFPVTATSYLNLKARLPVIIKQVGKIIGQGKYTSPAFFNYNNVMDYSDVINNEIGRNSAITTLFPHESTHYIPKTDHLTLTELVYLNSRISNKGYDIKNYDYVKGAQLVRAIYNQKDDKIFFMRNQNVPEEIKKQIKKITQPTSKRIGSALSYLIVGLQAKAMMDYDFAASCFYSSLLLVNKLSASAYEKAWIKRNIYSNMAEVYEKRNQPLLASMFFLSRNLNESFIKSESSKQAHVEYYKNIEKLAENTAAIENTAYTIQSSKNNALFLGLATTISTASARGGLANLSNADIAKIGNQMEASFNSTKESSLALIEVAQEVDFTPIEAKDNDGVNIELNQLYLAREIISHILLRPDQNTVAKQIMNFANDKPNLQYYLEEAYAEDDKNYKNQAIDALLSHLRMIETQATIYETRGRKVPTSKINLF